MSKTAVSLGDVEPARSRHRGRRSAVALTDECVVAGTASGTVAALDRATLEERWRDSGVGGSVVAATAFDGGIAVGERGNAGEIRVYDADGSVRWRYETAEDVGEPATETRFFLPFVASLTIDGDRLFVASRRYERDGEQRHFESVIYAFEPTGDLIWTYRTDASPISLDADADRVAVAYNRCPGEHQHGLVVLDAGTGEPTWMWDPGTEGQRRVGDVSLFGGGIAVASHSDYRGYLFDNASANRWTVDIARPRDVDGEAVYAYPNHVHATESGFVFVTGNTYPEDGRETEVSHPREHTAIAVDPDGRRQWTRSVGGFASAIGTTDNAIAVPCAQNFRERTVAVHALRVFDVGDGTETTIDAEGVVTAAAIDDETVAAIEEPVVYHDDGRQRGAYRLHFRKR